MLTKDVTITENQIVVDRQSILDTVRALDIGAKVNASKLSQAMDNLREPFFPSEISSGNARKDFRMNKY